MNERNCPPRSWLQASYIQDAFERLIVDHQDQFPVNEVFNNVLAPVGRRITVNIVRPDRDAIRIGPVIQDGDQFTAFVTVQINIDQR